MSRQLAQGHATGKQWSWDLNSDLGLFLYSIQVSITTLPWRLSHESKRRWKVRKSWRGKKVKLFWSFPAQLGKHYCSYQVIEVSTSCCQKGWMHLFLLAYMWPLRERHSRSFQVKKLWQSWEFLFRSDSTNMQNQCHWSFCLCYCLRHCLILT